MITVKAKQRILTHAEVSNLTGICGDHLQAFAKRHRLGFIARTANMAEVQEDKQLFTLWDLTVLVAMLPRCTH